MDRVLVTGVSGYLGSYVARELLERGYRVRGSVRTPSRGEEIRTALAESGTDVTHLELCRLDLLEDAGWPDAVADCRYVLHIASPFVLRMPKHDDELVRPAVEAARLDARHPRIGRRHVRHQCVSRSGKCLCVALSLSVECSHVDHERSFPTRCWRRCRSAASARTSWLTSAGERC